MEKPAGWQEEQAVEIRRDWIAYLADGMGIYAPDATGAELEALVVRRMLEQAEDELFEESFDEWDTDDEEEEDRMYSRQQQHRKYPNERRGITRRRRSRSQSRARDLSSAAPSEVDDDDDASSSAMRGAGGASVGEKRRPKGGVVGSKTLRRSQTTGDMYTPQRKQRVSVIPVRDDGSARYGGATAVIDQRSNRRNASVQRRGRAGPAPGPSAGGVTFVDSSMRQESIESRTSSRSRRMGAGSGNKGSRSGVRGGGGGLAKHRRRRSGGGDSSSALSVSSRGSRGSRGSSRSRGSDRSSVTRFDKWRDRLAGGDGDGCQKALERAGIYRHVGKDRKIYSERVADSDRRTSSGSATAHGRNSSSGSGSGSGSGRGEPQAGARGASAPAHQEPEPDVMSMRALRQVAAAAAVGKVEGKDKSKGKGKGGDSYVSAHRGREGSSRMSQRSTDRGSTHGTVRVDTDKDNDVGRKGRGRDHAAYAASEASGTSSRSHSRSRRGSERSDGSAGDAGRSSAGSAGSSRTPLESSGKRREGRRGQEHSASSSLSSSSAPVPTQSRKRVPVDAAAVAAPLSRSSDRKGGGTVVGFQDTNVSAAIKAALTAADSQSPGASFSENVAGGDDARTAATLHAAEKTVGDSGDGTRSRREHDAADGARQRGSKRKGKEDGQQRQQQQQQQQQKQQQQPSSSRRERENPSTAESRTKNEEAGHGPQNGSADTHTQPVVEVKSNDARSSKGKSSRRARSSKAAASAGGDRRTVVPQSTAGDTEELGRGDLDDLPLEGEGFTRSHDRRPNGNDGSASSRGSNRPRRGPNVQQGSGRRGSSSRRTIVTPSASSDDHAKGKGTAGSQAGEDGDEELAREAAAVVARTVAAGRAASASESTAVGMEALFAASARAAADGEGHPASPFSGSNPFYTEQPNRGDSNARRSSSGSGRTASRRASHAKIRAANDAVHTAPGRRGSQSVVDTGQAQPSASASASSSAAVRANGSAATSGPSPDPAELPPMSSSKTESRSRRRELENGNRAQMPSGGGTIRSRSRSTSRTSADTPGEQRSVPTWGSRGRSRERRGSGGLIGKEAAPVVAGEAGARRDVDRTGSVVQNTGAAAAAAARADNGGYGSDWDKLEMHRAVYASDKPGLQLFMQTRPQGLKQADHHGNTPLLLALKLGRTEMAWLMVRAGAELDVPSDGSFHLLDEAIVHGDEDLLVEVYGRLQRQSWGRWRAKVPDLLALLDDSIPDFYMEMHWSFECSNVLAPIVKAIAPHDHYRIWKKGSWLRMDSTITGYTKRFKTQRGKVSLLFLGSHSPAPGTLIKLDHGKKKIYNVLRRLESPTPSEVRRTCKRYLSSGHSKRPASQVDAYVIKAGELDFKPVTDFTGKKKTGTVGPWACEMYECTGDMQLQAFRKGAGDNLLQGLSMKNYFDVRQTLEEKVMRASGKGGSGSEEKTASPSPGPGGFSGSFFNFGERAAQSQKAKMLAKLKTPHKRYEKKIKASMWMCQDFPLTLEHVTPMLEVLSMQDKVIHKLKDILTTKGMREAGFPSKVSLPLYLGVNAAVTFDNCKVFKPGELEPELFLVNPQYSSSRRMRKGVYEGAMPGSNSLQPDGASGTPSLSASSSTATTTPYRGTPSSNTGDGASSAQQLQPRFKVWQPSFGPGSPQAPIIDIARALGGKSRTSTGTSTSVMTKTSAHGHCESGAPLPCDGDGGGGGSGGGESDDSEDFSANSSAALRAGAKGGTGLPSARLNAEVDAGARDARSRDGGVGLGAFGKTRSAAHVLRGSKPWGGGVLPVRGGGRGGEWEGGDSDVSDSDGGETSDEDDDEHDLILRR
eukprot:g8055.t1